MGTRFSFKRAEVRKSDPAYLCLWPKIVGGLGRERRIHYPHPKPPYGSQNCIQILGTISLSFKMAEVRGQFSFPEKGRVLLPLDSYK